MAWAHGCMMLECACCMEGSQHGWCIGGKLILYHMDFAYPTLMAHTELEIAYFHAGQPAPWPPPLTGCGHTRGSPSAICMLLQYSKSLTPMQASLHHGHHSSLDAATMGDPLQRFACSYLSKPLNFLQVGGSHHGHHSSLDAATSEGPPQST